MAVPATQFITSDTLLVIGVSVIGGLLLVIWAELRGLRKRLHEFASKLTVAIGRIGLLGHRLSSLSKRVARLEKKEPPDPSP